MKKLNVNGLGISTRVRFKTTPDSGVVVEKLGDGLVMVALDGANMTIPAFEEDLLREDVYLENLAYEDLIRQRQLDHLGLNKTGQKPLPIAEPTKILTNTGLSVAFLPVYRPNGEIEQFEILLINDTAVEAVFAFDMVFFDTITWQKEGIIKSLDIELLGKIAFDDINDLPEADVTITPIYTDNSGKPLDVTLKFKPKQFIKGAVETPLLLKKAYNFLILSDFDAPNASKTNNLKAYTRQLLENKPKPKRHMPVVNTVPKVDEFAQFPREIDLHIEILHDDYRSLTPAEIVAYQIEAFEAYLSQAVRLGVARVFVIHGIGTGRLKEKIVARLRRNPYVINHRNEYHTKYGFGATEVILKKG